MKAKEITELINIAFDAVGQSKVGKLYSEKDGKQVINTVPMQTFISVLNSLLPKSVGGKFAMEEPKEDWQK